MPKTGATIASIRYIIVDATNYSVSFAVQHDVQCDYAIVPGFRLLVFRKD